MSNEPKYPHRPPPPDGYVDWGVPPPHWHGYIYNDTEHAHSMEPWEECCPHDDDCVCVTQTDVDNWNKYSGLSSLLDLDIDKFSAYSAVAASADLWNSNYDTVSANSAIWNKASATDRLSALDALNSAYWEGASNIVCANSGKWNNYASSISSNSARIDDLSDRFKKTIKPYFDKDTIVGDGTEGEPYTVKNYEEYIKLLNEYVNKVRPLYQSNGDQNWVSLDATTDSDGINPYMKTLFNAINKKDNDQDVTLNNHGDLIQWIIKHLNPPPPLTGTDLTWKEIPKSALSSKSNLTATCTGTGNMWYSFSE